MTDYIYDIETYPSVFTCSVKEAGTDRRWMFEISVRRNDYATLLQFLRYLQESGARMVGFNNVGFDWPVIDFIMNNLHCTYQDIYKFAMTIIRSSDGDNRWSHIIWDPIIPQVDLFKIHHFDNKARSTSLKALEFNMRSSSIEDLPYPVGTWLQGEQIDTLIRYNMHDVDETEAFYHASADMIHFREELSARYNRNFLNHNDTKIGKDYFIMELERIMPGSCYVPGSRKPRQTVRESIRLGDVIFPYIQFTRPEFTAVRDWMAAQVISREEMSELGKLAESLGLGGEPLKTKGLFNNIPSESLGELAQYAELQLVKRASKDGRWQPGMKRAEHVNTVVQGFQFVFGTGGIHGSVSSRTVRSDAERVIIDIDAISLYPSLGIENRIRPAHLPEMFCDIYADMKTQRVSYPKGTPENAMLKLALNGVYGDSNNQYSPFYDPQYTMSITINGQLILCMLADYLMYIPGLEMIQINTDGITCSLPRANVWLFDQFCQWWEGVTRLDLEHVEYSAMHIADVNNYIAVKTDGKVKRKGRYEYVRGWHQDHSALVVTRAAEAFLLHGTPIEQFVRSHTDPLDFMLRAKVPRSSRLMLGDRQIQNVTRYYVSTTGAGLVKIMPPLAKKPDVERHIGIDVGWLVTECNRLPAGPLVDIDYRYYVSEAEKLVKPIIEGGGW